MPDDYDDIIAAAMSGPRRTRRGAIRYDAPDWNLSQLPEIESEYQKRSGQPLPVRNRGQGSIHNRWGLQHQNAADISLSPTSREGQMLMDQLRTRNIPFLAFDRAIPGASTGPHIHIGRPSQRTRQQSRQVDPYDDVINAAAPQKAPKGDYDDIISAAIKDSGQIPPPSGVKSKTQTLESRTSPVTPAPAKSVPKYSFSGRAFGTPASAQEKAAIEQGIRDLEKPRRRPPKRELPEVIDAGNAVEVDPQTMLPRQAPAMQARTPSAWERLKETVAPYVPGLTSIDTPGGIKTDPIRGALSGVTLGALGDPRQVSREEALLDPQAQERADLAYKVGQFAPAVVPYVATAKALSYVPLLNQATRTAQIARTAATFGGVELGREVVSAVKHDKPLDAKEIAISTAIGGAVGGLTGLNPSVQREVIAAITPQAVADAARGVDPETAVFNALTNALFGLHSAASRRGAKVQTQTKSEQPALSPEAIEGIKRAREDMRRAIEERKQQRGTQTEVQPPVEAQREAAESIAPAETTGQPVVERTGGVLSDQPDASSGSGTPPQRFYHKDFGEVEILPDQTGAGRNRYRVAEVNNPEAQHYVKKSQLTGRGNERMVPLRPEPQESGENITEPITKEATRQASLESGIKSDPLEVVPLKDLPAEVAKPREIIPENIQPLSEPANKISTETTAAGFKSDLSLSQFVRKMGGIVPSEAHRGEIDRIRLRETGTTGLINQQARQGNIKQTADIMMQAANDAGYRDPKTGQPFENPGDFLYAVERDVLGDKIRVRSGTEDFSSAEAEYYVEQEARVRAEEARDTFLESGRGAELFDKVRDGKASDAERTELTKLASEIGITKSELEDTLAGARAEIEGLEEVRGERPTTPTRPAEQLGFVQEGLTQQEAPPPSSTPLRDRLVRAEQARQAQLNPERTAALAKLEEIKRRGMTVDDYARQPDLMGNIPTKEEVAALKALESSEQVSDLVQPAKLDFDEQIEERHGGFPIGRALFGERTRIDTLGPKSVNPEAEARMKAAEGIQPPSVIRRAKEGLASVYHSFKRTFPEINPNKDDVSAVVNDHLRQLLAAPNYAKALAFDKIAEITENLGKERLRVFSRNLILPDILKDIDAGLYTDKPLPFGYKDRAQVETDLAKFQEAAESTPAIKDALERRQAFTKSLTEKLVSLDLLPKEVLDDPRYYHRQVMEYVNNPAWVGTGSADVRLHRKGFQKGRVGGGDFNTRYQEAEFEWTSQALSLIGRKEALARIQQVADIRPALDLEAKLWNEAHPENQKTWQDFIPETHRVWQPVKGSHFYPTMSITERTMDKILSGEKAFEESDVREILALGGKRQQWVIPEEIAKTLDEFRPYRDEGPIANVWTQAQSSWKQWVLLNPIRVLKYNLNNISGDLDITLAYNPKILKQAPRAARELWNYQVKGKGSVQTKAEIQDAIKRGVVDSGLTIVEIPDINKEGAFRGLTSPDPNIIQRTIQSYWGGVKTFTTWRENTLRLAAYRHFKERIAKGEQVYGASTKSQIDAIKDPNDKAAKLARELVGDYGAVSHAGQWIRRHLIPFYSWVEINAPRYVRLMRNLPNEGKSPAKAAASRVLTGAPKLAAKASVLYIAAQLWNHAMFPDEEKELRATGRTPHLILGRNEDGSIRVLRVEGALADALEWFGAEDLPYDIADVAKGKKGAGLKAKAAEAVKAPAERLVQSFEPFAKTIFETASGRTAYPSLFEKGESFKIRPRVIRDRTENVARVLSLDSLYRKVTGRPSPPSNGALNYIVNSVLTYRVDPGEAAYWDFRGKAFDWTKEKGKESGAADPIARSNALYYYKQALKWHDEKAAKRWLAEYQRLGGSDKGMTQSLRMGHPLGSIKKDDQAEFLDSLTDEERATLELAEKWYSKTYGDITGGRPPRPPAPPKPEAPARP